MIMGAKETILHKAIGLCIGVLLSYWIIDREFPVEQVSNSIVTPYVAAGQDIIYEAKVVRHRLCPVEIDRTIIDSSGVRYDFEERSLAAVGGLGSDTFYQRIRVPNTASPGTAKYRHVLRWTCNPIHKLWPVILVLPDMPFDIIPTPDQKN